MKCYIFGTIFQYFVSVCHVWGKRKKFPSSSQEIVYVLDVTNEFISQMLENSSFDQDVNVLDDEIDDLMNGKPNFTLHNTFTAFLGSFSFPPPTRDKH